ncbi:MAG: hypothetical protein IJ977_05020, partial [Fibrobacter sp.]|nr:hypothetical protein [Fibrobacter sp.]
MVDVTILVAGEPFPIAKNSLSLIAARKICFGYCVFKTDGVSPDFGVDYSKVMVSKGSLELPLNIQLLN